MSTDAPRYQPRYCEENVWHLAADASLPDGERFVVFIMSEAGRCPLWQQKAAPAADFPLSWDYHVILILRQPEAVSVWDLDSRLPPGCPLSEYLAETFPLQGQLHAVMEPQFRVIPATDYRANFASDRSHMRADNGNFAAPPPPWPPIGTGNNLHHYLTFRPEGPGHLYSSTSALLTAFS